jgi:hypothetical protein
MRIYYQKFKPLTLKLVNQITEAPSQLHTPTATTVTPWEHSKPACRDQGYALLQLSLNIYYFYLRYKNQNYKQEQ